MSRTVNIGIIGTGEMAGIMAQTIRKTRHARLYAVASRDIERAVPFGQTYKARKAYGSYQELLEDRRVKLVYIATPHATHYEIAKRCLEYGKSCLVEKPLAMNAQQAQELFDLAAENQLFISEAMWTRYLPFYQKIQAVLASGIIGAPVGLSASLGADVRQKPRLLDPELGGGTLLDLGIYTLNFASMFFGDDILRLNATCTYTENHLDEQDAISLVYRDGKLCDLSASMVGSTPWQGVIHCTKGYAVIDNIVNFETLSLYNENRIKIASYKRPRQKTGYEYEVAACVRALQQGAPETEEMPHAQTISLLHMMDFARRQFGIVYPCELPLAAEAPQAETADAAPASAPQIETAEAASASAPEAVEAAPASDSEAETENSGEQTSSSLNEVM